MPHKTPSSMRLQTQEYQQTKPRNQSIYKEEDKASKTEALCSPTNTFPVKDKRARLSHHEKSRSRIRIALETPQKHVKTLRLSSAV
jgi:hypothetical protein